MCAAVHAARRFVFAVVTHTHTRARRRTTTKQPHAGDTLVNEYLVWRGSTRKTMAKFGEIARRDVQRFISRTLAVAEINTAWLNLTCFQALEIQTRLVTRRCVSWLGRRETHLTRWKWNSLSSRFCNDVTYKPCETVMLTPGEHRRR